jgi:protocatechuate 3,4-dioxygenase beta subunit
MKRFLLLAVPILIIAGLTFWLQSSEPVPGDLTQGGQAETNTSEGSTPENLVGMQADSKDGARELVAGGAGAEANENVAQVLEEGENWLEGRVEWPEGQGWEESLQVYVVSSQIKRGDMDGVLFGDDEDEDNTDDEKDPVGDQLVELFADNNESRLLAQGQVEPDGRFRIALPAWRRSMHVQLLGRHLYLESASRVPAPPWNNDLVLRPEVGVWIHGQLAAPAGSDLENLTSVVRLYKDIDAANALVPGGGTPVSNFLCRTQKDGAFELRGVPVDEHAQLQVWPKKGAPLMRDLDAFVAGGTIELLIELEKGRTIAGLVKDPSGKPVVGAQIASFSQTPLAQARGPYRQTYSDETGHFELHALPAKPLIIRARHTSWINSDKYKIDGNKSVEDLIVTMKQGGHLSGTLSMPDGTPAVDVTVLANLDGIHAAGMEGIDMVKHIGARSTAKTDSEGHFSLKGMAPLPYKLGAKSEWQGQAVRVFLDDQRPQEDEIQVQLLPSPSLSGTVVDQNGEPVSGYTLLARQARTAPMFTVYSNEQLKHFDGDDGRFHLEDLIVGHWEIQVQGDDFILDPPFELDLPREDPSVPIVLTVAPAMTLTGRVVDPEGRGVPGAEIQMPGQGLKVAQRLSRSKLSPKGISDDDGNFKMGPLPSGAISLIATKDDWCRSEPMAVEFIEGQETPELVLSLRYGGTLIVEVFGEDGEVSPARLISVNNPKTPGVSETQVTDSMGIAEYRNVAEGDYNVVALGNSEKMMRDLDSGTLNQADILANMKLTTAEVLEGKETRVTLGSPPANPIAISGLITRGGQPLTDGFVSFSANGKSLLDTLALAEIKDDGSYETTLDGEGRYRITIQITSGNFMEQTTTEFVRDIAQAESVVLNLELPEGRISGVVLDPQGRPAPRVRLSVQASGPAPTSTMLGGSFVERQTADDGSFDVNGLQPGTYTVFAGGSVPFGLGTSEGPTHGRVSSAPIRLRKDQAVEGLRLRLQVPGSITCRVTNEAGVPVNGASVFVRDSSGRPIEAFSLVTTQATGLCTYKGLAPGSYTISARSSDLASAESSPIKVKAGEDTEVNLTGRSGTTLRLLFKNSDGDPSPARLQVLNDQDLDMVRMFGATDMALLYSKEPFMESERRIGPLPPGRYKVIAIIDGKTVEKSLRLRGKATMRLTLRAR